VNILDTLSNLVEKHPDLSQEQHNTLLQAAMETFGNSGGLSQLVSKADSLGLGHIVSSWIGTGSNQAVCADQVQQMVGQDRLTQFANRAGISSGLAGAALARILPALVDRLTPHGKLPQAA
jgi:uncharacterized protein YidB (DUF937 family)